MRLLVLLNILLKEGQIIHNILAINKFFHIVVSTNRKDISEKRFCR